MSGRSLLGERQTAEQGVWRERASSGYRPVSAGPVQHARAGASACSAHSQVRLARSRELEATSGVTWRPLQPLNGSATRTQFMRSNCKAFAEYSFRLTSLLAKCNWRPRASDRANTLATLGRDAQRLLAEYSFKVADYSFFDTYEHAARGLAPGQRTGPSCPTV